MPSKGSAPTPPDPQKEADAQTAANKSTAITQSELNQVDQVTPYGNLSYAQTGTNADGTPKYTATTTLSPAEQGLLDQTNSIKSALAGYGQTAAGSITPLDLSSANVDKFTNSHFGDDFNNQWDKNYSQLATQLANQGVYAGSDAYTRALGDFNASKANAYDNMEGNQFQNAVQDIIAQHNSPINDISAITGATQTTNPTLVNTPQTNVANTDVAGIDQQNYANQLAQYQQQQAQQQQVLGGLFGLGSNLLMLSDRRAKTDIKEVGRTFDDQPVYSYRYKSGGPTQIGLMAQDVEKRDPGAVVTMPSGLKLVDYGRALEAA